MQPIPDRPVRPERPAHRAAWARVQDLHHRGPVERKIGALQGQRSASTHTLEPLSQRRELLLLLRPDLTGDYVFWISSDDNSV